MLVATGSYTGDGLDNKAITVGFQPIAVIVKKDNANNSAFLRTDTMPSGSCKRMVSAFALSTLRIKTFTATGFTVGTDDDVNTSAALYQWLALGDNGAGDIDTVTYTGDGLDNRAITTTINPDLVFVGGDAVVEAHWRTNELSGDLSQPFNWSAFGDRIQSLGVNTFQVGTAGEVNTNLTVYHALCLKKTTGVFNIVEYIGDGLDNKAINGFGFQPVAGWVQDQGTIIRANMRFSDMTAGESVGVAVDFDLVDGIKTFAADGITVGTNAQVNASAKVYTAVMFAPGGTTPSVSGLSVSYGAFTRTGINNTPWGLAFTPSDTDTPGADALTWQVRTATGGGGTLVASGTCTHLVPVSATIAYNAAGLVNGNQTLQLRLSDGTLASDTAFTLKRDDDAPTATTAITVTGV